MTDTTATLAQLRTMAASVRSLATRRLLTLEDIDRFEAALADAQARGANRVRVYAGAGFVPNSYRWQCLIQHVEARRQEDGAWRISTGVGGAQRSGGRGNLTVVV